MHLRSIRFAAVVAALVLPGAALADAQQDWAERVLYEWMNRARCDPQVEMTACGANCAADAACYGPMLPLVWDEGTATAARFHADEMRLQGYYGHDSMCTVVANIAQIYPASCDGSASCACAGGVRTCNPTCTTWSDRIGLFVGGTGSFSPALGENLESGFSDPDAAFYLWLYEASSSTLCTASATNLHRWSILKGIGYVGATMSGTLGVMDFTRASVIPSVNGIVSGAHYPRQGASVEAWANWYGASPAPSSAAVVVDGSCTAMTLERGTQTNGAWRAILGGLDSSCHRYFFAFQQSGGTVVTSPDRGSFGIGDASCADFSTYRPALGAGCAALVPCDPAPGGCDDGNPCTADACTASGCAHVARPNGTACDDGNACTVADTCQSGACVSGSPVTCASAGPCTIGVCDPTSGSCTIAPAADGASCTDGNPCNGAETCQSGACEPGTPLDCDDGNPCTVDACDPVAGCTHTNAPATTDCSDGLACNGTERCDGNGACVPGPTCQGVVPDPPKSSGCGCGAGSSAGGLGIALLVLAAAGPRARRRRG